MLEKKGSTVSGVHCSSASSSDTEVSLQIPPLNLSHHNSLQELPEDGELDIVDGCGGGGRRDADEEGSINKKRKPKGSSLHSSDEIIDEEDHLPVSDADNDIPIIPGIISHSVTANTSDADFDSAFEDSLYSGSSDDKTKNKGHGGRRSSVMKTKSHRRYSSTATGKQDETNLPTQQGTKCENIVGPELEDIGGESNKYQRQEYNDDHTELSQQEIIVGHYLDLDEHHNFDNLNEPELTLFEMEVSPANHQRQDMPALDEKEILAHPRDQDYKDENIGCDMLSRRLPPPLKGHYTSRKVHYDDTDDAVEVGGHREHSNSDDDESIDQDVEDIAQLDTILLAPPLDMEVELSPEGSLTNDMNLTCAESLQKISQCPPQFHEQSCEDVVGPIHLKSSLISQGESSSQQGDDPILVGIIDGCRPSSSCANSPPSPNQEGGDKNDQSIAIIPYFDGKSQSQDFDVVYVVPDGGWGWMVLFGSILVNILIPGTVKSFGILFVEFLQVFNATPTAAAWIPALSYWLYSSMGPFAGALATKYSHRSVTIVGGLLASLGLMLSYFATSIPYLYISYGIIGGLGAGLAYPIGVFMVGQYFEKKRGLANGLCTSGSALGSVLIPPLLRVLDQEYGYRGAILIMGIILLNVCLAAMFYDPVDKHMKKTLVPRDKSGRLSPEEEVDKLGQPNIEYKQLSDLPQRQVTGPIPSKAKAPIREVAASMPIAIPLPLLMNTTDFRDVINRRGSNSGRKATFQIGQEDDSWSYQSNEVASPLAARLVKEDHFTGTSSPNKWSFYNPGGIRVRGHLPGNSSNPDSNPELETLIHSTSTGAIVNPPTSGTALNLSGVGTSQVQSRLNLTAIPEDDDTASECNSRQVDWTYYSALPPAKQRLLRLSVNGGTQLMNTVGGSGSGGSQSAHPSSGALVNQAGLPRTLSVASNVSNSSFHYMSTIHHGSLLTAMQFDKNIPDFASTLTLKSVQNSCCPRLSTMRGFLRKLTCGLWPSIPQCHEDEHDYKKRMVKDVEETLPLSPIKTKRSDKLKKFIDFSLLKDGMYLIMLMSNSTTAVGYTNFIVLLPSYALAMGFDKSQAASLLSIVAALDFVGRIGGAALSDLQFISRKWYYIIGLFFSGVALAFLPWARTYSSLLTMCACFGLASGTYIGVTAVILADQLGAEKLGSSYGISLFLNGLLQLVGPPVCGALYQHIGNLEPIFTGLGITLIFGALLWIFAPFIERNRALKEKLKLGLCPLGEDTPVQNINVTTSLV